MFEGWAAVAVGAAASVVGGAMQGRGASKAADKQVAADKEIAKIQGQEQRKTTAFEADLADYYSQLNTQRRRDARGSMYDKYSLVQKPEGYQRQALVGAKPVSPDSTTTTGAAPNAVPRAQQLPVLNQPTH
jgi:hypothetical protein